MMTSPIADGFKRRLPKELQDVAEVSFSYQFYWKIVSDHLKKLYGEYAYPQHCLDAYYNSPEYRDNREIIRRCPDIPLITMDDIQKMLNEEKQYAETVRKLLSIFKEKDGDEKTNELAKLLGLFPNSNITDLRWCIELYGSANEIIIPVGYQPMMRCSQQHGYMMLTHSDYDLYKDKRFDKFRFRLTEDICNWIYEEMDQGNSVYPNDDIPDISPEIEALNNNTIFSQEVFTNATEILNLKPEDVMNLKAVLKGYGITIVETVDTIAPEKLDKINQEYSARYVMEKMGIFPQIYPMVHLPHDVEIILNY